MKKIFLIFLSAGLLNSCSSGGGSSGASYSPPSTLSKDQALQKLPDGARKSFESWKTQIIKSCDAGESVGQGPANNFRGVDTASLLESNNHSIIFKMSNDEFALVNGFASFDGNRSDSDFELNDNTQNIKVTATLIGSECSISVFGTKVYQTFIAKNVSVAGYFSIRNLASFESHPKLSSSRLGNMPLIEGHELSKGLHDTFRSNPKALSLIAKTVKLNQDQVSAYFSTSNDFSLKSSYRVAGDGIWADREFETLSIADSTASAISNYQKFQLKIEDRISVPTAELGADKNTTDTSFIDIFFIVSFTPNKAGSYAAKFEQATSMNLKTYDDQEAIRCVQDRARVLSLSNPDHDTRPILQPSFESVFQPCQKLSLQKVEDLFYSNGDMKALTTEVVSQLPQTSDLDYNGWDFAVTELAKSALAAGKDVQTELDPQRQTQVFTRISNFASRLKTEISASRDLETKSSEVYGLAVAWAMKALGLGDAQIHEISQALANTIIPFEVSAQTLIENLKDDPTSQERTLRFAIAIDQAYKDQSAKAKALAQELQDQTWLSEVYNQILQRQISQETLQKWTSVLTSLKNQLAKYPNLASMRSDLTELSVKILKPMEGSTSNSTAQTTQIEEAFAALNNAADSFPESTRQLILSLKADPVGTPHFSPGNQTALEYARLITPDMKNRVADILTLSVQIGLQDFANALNANMLQLQTSAAKLVDIQKSMRDAIDFSKRENSRVGADRFLNDDYKKEIISRAVTQESWSHGEFQQLEQIATYAKVKMECQSYKGASSLANCVGLSFFSQGPGKFFDPTFGSRYGALAVDLAKLEPTIDSEGFAVKTDVEHAFFGAFDIIWNDCDAASFTTKSNELKSILRAYPAADFLRRIDLEKQLRANVENCSAG